MLAGSAGIWLFYVQHQFEDVYWERSDDWSYADAALRGSSYLKLPKVLQFFTGNIGLHHVHHLSARIPNYNLQRAHDENPVFHAVPRCPPGTASARSVSSSGTRTAAGWSRSTTRTPCAPRPRPTPEPRLGNHSTDAESRGSRSSERPGRADAHAGRAAKPDG